MEDWEHLGYRFQSTAVDMPVLGGILDAHPDSVNGCNSKCGDSQKRDPYHLRFNFLFIQ